MIAIRSQFWEKKREKCIYKKIRRLQDLKKPTFSLEYPLCTIATDAMESTAESRIHTVEHIYFVAMERVPYVIQIDGGGKGEGVFLTRRKLELLFQYGLSPQGHSAEHTDERQSQRPEDELPRGKDQRWLQHAICWNHSHQPCTVLNVSAIKKEEAHQDDSGRGPGVED